MKKYAYVNGKIVDINKPAVALNDIGLLRAHGVFDFLRTYNGKLFHYSDHFSRFVNSAKTIGLAVPSKKDEVGKMIYHLMKQNKVKEASIRLLCSGGPSVDGYLPAGKPTFAILLEDIYTVSPKLYQTGAKVITCEHERVFPSAKTINYTLAITLIKNKKQAGAIELLYTKNGRILECEKSNFFLVRPGKLITADKDILKGITRKIVISLAKKLGLVVEERDVLVDEIGDADEAFLTSTVKHVLPIVKIDDRIIGDGKVGPITKQIMEAMTEAEKKN